MKTRSAQAKIMATFLLLSVFISACKNNKQNTPIPAPVVLSCNDINADAVWADRGDGIDYILNCVISVNAKLTIQPGVTIQCKNGAGIIVETTGTFIAAGTTSKPIIMAGDVDVAGIWKGIYIRSSSVLNEISYCTISHAGNSSFDGSTDKMANIRLSIGAKLKLTNSTISKSLKDGLLIDGFDTDNACPITTYSSNTFTANQNYPVSSVASLGNVLDGTNSSYSGNTYDKVLFRGGRLFGTHTWQKMNVPYLVKNVVSVGYDVQDGNLTINPGVTVQFATDAGLCTGDYSGGSWMKIVGSSPPNIITLTGETQTPGAWKGIAFQSTSSNNQISYAEISYGGSSSYTGNTAQRGNIMAGAWSAGSFTMDNTNVLNSAAWGIYATLPSPAITVAGSNYLSGNASGNYHHE